MDFNKLRLPDMAITDLFKNSIIQGIGETDQLLINPPSLPVKATEKSSSILIAVNYPGSDDIAIEQYLFLSTVLNACQLNIKDAVIINMARQALSFADLALLSSHTILLFGINSSLLNPLAESLPFEVSLVQGIRVLTAPALDEFTTNSAQSRHLKTKLWAGLKEIFTL